MRQKCQECVCYTNWQSVKLLISWILSRIIIYAINYINMSVQIAKNDKRIFLTTQKNVLYLSNLISAIPSACWILLCAPSVYSLFSGSGLAFVIIKLNIIVTWIGSVVGACCIAIIDIGFFKLALFILNDIFIAIGVLCSILNIKTRNASASERLKVFSALTYLR